MVANLRQVGGTHYKTLDGGLQHWDIIDLYGIGYLEGCATKYISRARKKNGIEDLHKAMHYIEKMIDLYHTDERRPRGSIPGDVLAAWYKSAGLNAKEAAICSQLLGYWTVPNLETVLVHIQDLMAEIDGNAS